MSKRKAAFVEEEDPETGSPIPGSENSASFFLSPEQSSAQRKRWRKSEVDFMGDSISRDLGPMLEVLELHGKKRNELLTIVAGEHEDNAEVWKKCQDSGVKFRMFPLQDHLINGEHKTYAAREILLSKHGGDLDQEHPDVLFAQRIRDPDGNTVLRAHHIFFGHGKIDLGRPYIFPGLGDEVPGIGCPDLHCTFRAIRDWETAHRRANFAGCDRSFCIDISAENVEEGKKIVFDVEKGQVVGGREAKPRMGIEILCVDFRPMLDWNTRDKYPSPPQKSGIQGSSRSLESVPKTVSLKLIGMGPELYSGSLRADVNLDIVLHS